MSKPKETARRSSRTAFTAKDVMPTKTAKVSKPKKKPPANAKAHDPLSSEKNVPFLILRQVKKIQGQPPYEIVSISFRDHDTISDLRSYCNSEQLYNATPLLRSSQLFYLLPNLQQSQNAGIKRLVKWLNAEFADTKIQLDNLLKEGVISFDLLWYIFKKDDEVYNVVEGMRQGGRVTSVDYQHTFFGSYLIVNVQQVKSNGRKFYLANETFRIPDFKGTKKIEFLPVSPMNPETRKVLTERGRMFESIANKATYLEYSSHMVFREWFGTQSYRANGRCMIDQTSFSRINPRYGNDRDGDEAELDVIPEDLLFACDGWVKGFSFFSKRWGEFSLDNLSPVTFNDTAFDSLVLEQETKTLVRALVENSGNTFQDIIYGKGGGCIFLLHGEPGTGKTLTAESIAEIQHRPLYSVSVGELGTDPKKLEESLRQILEMATVWNAVILIDEADIFLEARSDDSDVDRNAMVGIFLRLLEYHQGILFLTTNRVLSFDKAFHSRISVAIKYPNLGLSERTSIWNNLLAAAGVIGADAARLAEHNVNGRQIKTAIRLAQALAKSEGTGVTTELLERPIAHSERFLKDVEQGRSVMEVAIPVVGNKRRKRAKVIQKKRRQALAAAGDTNL